jgi:hypothetical protein
MFDFTQALECTCSFSASVHMKGHQSITLLLSVPWSHFTYVDQPVPGPCPSMKQDGNIIESPGLMKQGNEHISVKTLALKNL